MLINTALYDSDSEIRVSAARTLQGVPDESVLVSFLSKLTASSDVRVNAVAALGALGDKRAVAYLAAMLDSKDGEVARAAYRALTEILEKQEWWSLFANIIDSKRREHDRREDCSHHVLHIKGNGEYCLACGACLRVSSW